MECGKEAVRKGYRNVGSRIISSSSGLYRKGKFDMCKSDVRLSRNSKACSKALKWGTAGSIRLHVESLDASIRHPDLSSTHGKVLKFLNAILGNWVVMSWMADRMAWELGDHVVDDQNAHTTHTTVIQRGRQWIICYYLSSCLPDEVYALNMQLSTLRKKTHSPVKGTYLLWWHRNHHIQSTIL